VLTAPRPRLRRGSSRGAARCGSGPACSSSRRSGRSAASRRSFSIVYALVPGTKYFRAPSTMLYVGSVLAAGARRGTELIEAPASGVSSTRYVIGWVCRPPS
jgi:hypothetical protein